MSFQPASRDWTTIRVPTKASTTYTQGAFIYSDGSDNVPVVDATEDGVIGIAKESKASSSATTHISVLAPLSQASTFYADMESGESLAADDPGEFMDFATGSGDNLGVTISTASTYDAVQCVKYVSTKKGVFRLNYITGVHS